MSVSEMERGDVVYVVECDDHVMLGTFSPCLQGGEFQGFEFDVLGILRRVRLCVRRLRRFQKNSVAHRT